MKYSKEQLIERAKDYLKDVDSIIVTDDGQVFHNNKIGKADADAHARTKKIKTHEVTLKDVKEVDVSPKKAAPKPPTKPVEPKKVEKVEEVKEEPKKVEPKKIEKDAKSK